MCRTRNKLSEIEIKVKSQNALEKEDVAVSVAQFTNIIMKSTIIITSLILSHDYNWHNELCISIHSNFLSESHTTLSLL